MAALDNYNLAALEGDFRKKIHSLMLKVCTQIAGEDSTGKQAIYIQKRADKVDYTILNQIEAVDILSHLVASKGTLTNSSNDADIEFTIVSVWDDYSGVMHSETI